MNSSLDETTQELVIKHYYNFGIATDTEHGLIVPVIKDVDQKSIPELAKDLAWMGFDMIARANNHSYDYTIGGMEATTAAVARMKTRVRRKISSTSISRCFTTA